MTPSQFPDESLEGSVAVVTGAGSPDGIGFAVARRLAIAGCTVAIGATGERIHDRVASLLDEDFDAVGFIGDLIDPLVCDRLVEAIEERFGRLDVLVNSAGMTVDNAAPRSAPLELVTDAMWHDALDRNLTTAFNMTRAVVPLMRGSGSGRIVNVSSLSGTAMAFEGEVGYHAAKAGIAGLTRAAAVELSRHGIIVNAVAPGWMATGSSTDAETTAAASTPLGRAGTPGEIAAVVEMLARPGGYMCGQVLVVDGGNSLVENRRGTDTMAS
ncbi:MAG: SDR family oxidoreductase [Microthrixaceae bacterium]